MRFEGSYVALATPFKRDGTLDEAALSELVRRQVRGGTSGLVPCGSTGEAATLSPTNTGASSSSSSGNPTARFR
jgi:4-hydroxy-tetrahydrodipicolinate synthase